MQRELRDMLERKVAMGGNYFDMSGLDMGGDMDIDFGGDLIAGARRRRRRGRRPARRGRKPAHMVKGSEAARRHMAKLRRMRGRGGDFVDVNDYAGGAKSGIPKFSYKNPIDRALKEEVQTRKDQLFALTKAGEYADKLQRKADLINKAIDKELDGVKFSKYAKDYNDAYVAALKKIAPLGAVSKAARKMGIPLKELYKLEDLKP